MQVTCEYCGNCIDGTAETCPFCGASNANKVPVATGVFRTPRDSTPRNRTHRKRTPRDPMTRNCRPHASTPRDSAPRDSTQRNPTPRKRTWRDWLCLVLYIAIQWTWGILQNIAGLLIFAALLIAHPKRARDLRLFHGAVVVAWSAPSSMALGMFIFFGHDGRPDAAETLVHEYGHTIQSCILGPAYLLVIGLPSVIWAWWPSLRRARREGTCSYFDFYTEKWANACGARVTHEPAPKR